LPVPVPVPEPDGGCNIDMARTVMATTAVRLPPREDEDACAASAHRRCNMVVEAFQTSDWPATKCVQIITHSFGGCNRAVSDAGSKS
jgi:hypothetical protein